MLAFKWSWAVPERSGVVPGGSRARIIDFSLVLEGLGGAPKARARAGHPEAEIFRPPKTLKSKKNTKPKTRYRYRYKYRYRYRYRHRYKNTLARLRASAVADILNFSFYY